MTDTPFNAMALRQRVADFRAELLAGLGDLEAAEYRRHGARTGFGPDEARVQSVVSALCELEVELAAYYERDLKYCMEFSVFGAGVATSLTATAIWVSGSTAAAAIRRRLRHDHAAANHGEALTLAKERVASLWSLHPAGLRTVASEAQPDGSWIIALKKGEWVWEVNVPGGFDGDQDLRVRQSRDSATS